MAETSTLPHAALKDKQRRLREAFPQPLALRVHRALSWLGRSELEAADSDVQFVLLWIGFNAAYAGDLGEERRDERGQYAGYFEALVELDPSRRIYDAIWRRYAQEIRVLLDNRFVYSPFWKHHNGETGAADWEARLRSSQRVVGQALTSKDTATILSVVFDRLYVLRNQLMHGGATWHGSVNRAQVVDGAAVLSTLLPVFIDVMMDNPGRDWGPPYYPVV